MRAKKAMSKYFKPYITACRNCNEKIAMLKSTGGEIKPVNLDSLTEQEKYWIRIKENFFYNFSNHTLHFESCKAYKEFRKPKNDIPQDKRYGD